MPIVREITVHGNQKNWGEVGNNGKATGIEIAYTVVPEDTEILGWTVPQANLIALQLRFEIQKIILADTQIRGVPVPADAGNVLKEYETKIRTLKDMVGEVPNWKEKTEQASDATTTT